MKVLKFGGTSVGSWENILRVKNIVESNNDQTIVVVSAVGGVTDRLINMGTLAQTGDEKCFADFKTIKQIHDTIIEHLFKGEQLEAVSEQVELLFTDLDALINGVFMLKELTEKSFASISSFGEKVSSYILSQVILGAKKIDSEKYIITDKVFGRNQVDVELTYENLLEIKSSLPDVSVFPGFISSNKIGETTTLGRGGSDYTAALIAAALDAEVLEIWTDVDGFMTADPRVINRAYSIEQLSYSEAMELSHFGAKVIYPPTILPVYKKNIPTYIKNTLNPTHKGTLIDNTKGEIVDKKIKGISSIGNVSLVTVQGIGMVGVTGIAMRLFQSLANKSINVILISQASSENSISLVVETKDSEAAQRAIEEEFAPEINLNQINKLSIEDEMSVVAIVGENMKHTTGISGKLFDSLGKNGINISAIAQGASELNISFVVKQKDLKKALNVIHESFFLSDYTVLNLFLVGLGTVGGKLLQQLNTQASKLLEENKLQIKLVGIANSRKMLFSQDGLEIESVSELLNKEGEQANLAAFAERIAGYNLSNSVFVDCTAHASVAELYQSILESNVSVVTANKIASSSDYSSYKKLKETARTKGVKFLFETNVGAGLPIISPLNDLVKSGDKILKLEAVLSGTLNFIVNTISEEKPLSVVIQEAKDNGFSEPDPRLDLSGMDVARKLLILSREAGYKMEMDEINVSPFVSEEYLNVDSVDAFMTKVADLDKEFELERQRLVREGKCWRYAARLENGKTSVSLIEVDSTHPFYDLEGSNNIVLFTTERYKEHPMQIKGYGAGADVTAAGVFADIIKVANI